MSEVSGDKMHRPRDDNGRFTTFLTMSQFDEFRIGLEQRFQAQENAIMEGRRGMDQRFAAQEKALESARVALKELTATHSEAHKAEHEASQKALALESNRVNGRLEQVEGRLVERVVGLENAALVSATTTQVENVAKSAVRATIGSVIAGVVSILAGIVAVVSAVNGAG